MGSRFPAIIAAAALGLGALGLGAPASAVTTAEWNTNLGTGLSATGEVLAVQPDGKLLVGGQFGAVNEDGDVSHLARFNTDGTIDSTFVANLGTGFNNTVSAIAVEADGQVLVGGYFTMLNGVSVPRSLVRLNSDGTLDTAFANALGTGFSSAVSAIRVMVDGDILIGGYFTTLDTSDVPDRLVRLNSDGTTDSDTGFNTNLGSGFDSPVAAIATDGNDFIVVGGTFQTLNGSGAIPKRLLYLNGSGVSATTYNVNLGTGVNATVFALALLGDNSLYVGGDFTALNGDANTPDRLLRLTPSGESDNAFANIFGWGLSGGGVYALAARPDGGVFVGGDFTTWSGNSGPLGLLAFEADGSVDSSFTSHLGGGVPGGEYVYGLAALGNDDVVLTGNVTSFGNYTGTVGYLLRVKTPTVPGKSRAVRVTPGDSSARVTWSMPQFDGGSPITEMSVTINPSGTCTIVAWNAESGSANCTGLVNGAPYTVIVTARNAVGAGVPAYANTSPRTTPGLVRGLSATSVRPGKARITWETPASNGGARVLRYDYCMRTCSKAANWKPASVKAVSAFTLSGLRKGAKYTVRVRAVNAAGHGPAATLSFRQTRDTYA